MEQITGKKVKVMRPGEKKGDMAAFCRGDADRILCFLIDDEGLEVADAISQTNWELTGLCTEEEEEERVGEDVDPCPTFFTREPQFCVFEEDDEAGASSEDGGEQDLQAMVRAQ